MKIKFDESGKVLGFVELGGMDGAVEFMGDIPADFRENCGLYRLVDGQLIKDEALQRVQEASQNATAELDELYSWFAWYDNQIAQFMRAQRLGQSYDRDIGELDALAAQKQTRIRELREVLSWQN